jgi:hypothetical protein
MTIKRKPNEIRKSKMRNLACICGSGKKYKVCCARQNWPIAKTQYPNILGSFVANKINKLPYVIKNEQGQLFKTFRNQAIWTNIIGEARRYRTLDKAQEIVKNLKEYKITAEVSTNV